MEASLDNFAMTHAVAHPHRDDACPGQYAHRPQAIETFLQLQGVSTESKRKILWEHCARLYGVH
jgi:hypothetical protein